MAEETGSKITYYTNFDDFFNHDMDAVVLANYANEHAPFAIRLLYSGRHVVSEVLPVETLAQAVQLVEAVEKSGKVYSYAENYCYFLATQEMKNSTGGGISGSLCTARENMCTTANPFGPGLHMETRTTGETGCIRLTTAPTA